MHKCEIHRDRGALIAKCECGWQSVKEQGYGDTTWMKMDIEILKHKMEYIEDRSCSNCGQKPA